MDDFNAAVALIEDHPDVAEFSGPKTEDAVRKAEQELGVCFPPTYRAFLLKFGCGSFGSEEFYGISKRPDADLIPNVVKPTLGFRTKGDLPANYVLVYGHGNGEYVAIDANTNQPIEARVVIWPRVERVEVVAPDFGVFFLETIRKALAR